VTTRSVTRDELLEAARVALKPGVRPEEAVVLAYAKLVGEPLDPRGFDDAAILLRAVRLLDDEMSVAEAVATARREGATWGLVR
jgi:hypothetical protein